MTKFIKITTKPIHESQSTKPKKLDDGRWEITLKVQVNFELQALLRSFGKQVEVVAPESLRENMRQTALDLLNLYDDSK